MGQRCKDTAKSLARSEKELRDLLSVSVLGGSYKAPVGGSVVNLRSFMVIILENSFSWLNREGQLQDFPLTTREVAISPELLMDIEEGLFGYVTGRRKVVKQGDVDGEDQPQGTVVMDPDAVYGGVKPMNNDAPSLIGMSIDPSGNGIAHTSGGDPNLVAMGNVDGLKTVMCLSPTMLVSDNNRTHPDNSYSLDMPQMFYYSSLDTKKLFHLLGHWQVEDLKRSVLVAAACNVTGCDPTTTSPFSADGWICHTETLYEALIAAKPGAGELDANDEDRIAVVLELANSDELTEKWHGVDGIGRSMIRQVAVGSMSLARRNLGLRAGLNRPMNPKNLSCIDITAEVTSIYGQLCVRRNVWEVRTHTVQPNRMGECSKLELNPLKDGYGSSLIRNIRDVKRSSNGSVNNHHSSSVITVGPVVGKVTPTTAVVLMDFSNLLPSYHRFNSGGGSNTNYIELVATDAITGMEYSASASFLPSQPLPVGNTAGAVSQSVLFAFDELMPFRPYDLRIASDDGVFLSKLAVLSANTTSGVPVTDASGHVGALILGSFCTPPIMADAATRATAISLTALLMNGGNPDIEYREDHGIGGINRDMAMYSPEEVMLMKSLRNVAQDRASAGDGYHANNMLPNAANNANLFGLNNDSSYVMNPRQMQMQTLLSTAGGGDADGGVIAMATSSSPCYYYRILVVGANRPNWLPHNYTDTNLNGTASGCSSAWCGDDEVTLGHQRGYLEESLKLCGAVNNMLGSSSYNIIDLVLHVGCSNVDLSVTIMEVIKLLTKAEELLYFDTYYSAMNVNHTCPAMHSPANANVSQRGNPATGSVGNNGSTVAGLLLQAKEMLRHAYSLHWGSNALMKNHLSHGSHMFVSSPMVELITVLNSASLHTLCRELSHYTTSQLLSIITDVDFEFQQRLWRSPDSTLLTLIGKSGSSSANAMNATGSAVANATTGMSPSLEAVQSCDYIHYVGDGSIAVFVIKLRLVPQFTAEAEARNSNPGTHHNSASFDDTKCLIGNEQLLMLEKILMEKVHFIKTLIVVSPIAVFSESNSSSFVRNSGHKDGSYKHEYLFSAVLGGSGGSINYNVIDISRLLDIVFHWKARVEELKQMQAQRTTDGNVRGSEMDPPSSSSGAGSDVIFICGGEGIGVTTTIECTLNSHGGGGGNFHVASMGIGAFPSQSFVAHQLSSYVDPVMGQRSGAQPSVVTVENENSMFPVHGEGNEVVPGENVGQEQSHVRKVASYDLKIQQLCVGSFMSVPGEGLDDILASAAVPIVISEQQALLEQQALQQNSHEEVEAGGGLEEDSNKEVALDPEPQNEQQEEMLPDENAEVDDSGEEPDVADRSDPPVGGLGVGFAEEVEYQEEPRPVSSSNRKTTSSRPVTGNVNFDANPSIPSASLLPNVSCWQCISPFTHIQYSFRHTSVQYHPHCALVEVNHSAPVSPLSQNYPMQQPDNDRMHPDQGLDGMLPESHIDEGGPEPVQGLLPGYGYSNNLHNNISILERASNVLNKDLVSRINREVTRGGGGSIPTLGGSYLHQQAFSAASMFNNDHTRSNPNAHPHPPQYARIALLDTSSVEALSSVIGDLSMLPIDVANMWAQAAELTRLTDDELINVAQQSGFDLEQSSSYVTMPTTNAAPGDRENEEAASDLLNFKKESDKSRDLLHGALTNGDIRIVALAVRKFCRQYTEVFYACHESFSNNEFGLLHGKHISIAIFTLSNIVQWLINHLPNDVVNMIPYPSSLVIRLVWLKFVQPYNTITDQVRSDELALAQDKEAMAALGNGGSTVETTGEDVFNSMLVADRSYFYRFFMQLFECSALMEQLAFIEGLNDGWM